MTDTFQHLNVSNLTVQFLTPNGLIQPVDGVSFEIQRGEDVGLIGESGCGKTVTALSLLGFERGKPGIVAGRIRLNGTDLLPDWDELFGKDRRPAEIATLKRKKWGRWQRKLLPRISKFRGSTISIAFQDATKMLDPLFTVGQQLAEAVVLSDSVGKGSKAATRQEAVEWLRRVEMPDPSKVFSQYPHQLSGGMLQRVILAIALASKPGLLIADEPTTGLDVTVGSKILLLLKKLCDAEGLTLLVISHDLAVIRELTKQVIVMYAGQIVEVLESQHISSRQVKHPYTQALLDAQVSDTVINSRERLRAIEGEVPKPEERIAGCRFHPRCPLMKARETAGDAEFVERCKSQQPELISVAGHGGVRCWEFEDGGGHES